MIRPRSAVCSINSYCRYYNECIRRIPTRNNYKDFKLFRLSSTSLSSKTNKNKNNSEYCIKEEICMPELGDGHVERWLKKEGDLIQYEEPYNEISTDYFPFGMTHDDPYPVLLHKIVAKENQKVKEGDVLCIFLRKEDNDDDAKDKNINDDDDEYVITSDEINEKIFNKFK